MTVACMCISLVICRPKCVFVSIILVFVSLCFCVLEFVYVCCLCMYVRLSACLPTFLPFSLHLRVMKTRTYTVKCPYMSCVIESTSRGFSHEASGDVDDGDDECKKLVIRLIHYSARGRDNIAEKRLLRMVSAETIGHKNTKPCNALLVKGLVSRSLSRSFSGSFSHSHFL